MNLKISIRAAEFWNTRHADAPGELQPLFTHVGIQNWGDRFANQIPEKAWHLFPVSPNNSVSREVKIYYEGLSLFPTPPFMWSHLNPSKYDDVWSDNIQRNNYEKMKS